MNSIYKVLWELINSTFFFSKQMLPFTPNNTEQNYWSGVYVNVSTMNKKDQYVYMCNL